MSCPTTSPELPWPPLNHVPKCQIYISIKYFQGGDSATSLGSLSLCLAILFTKKFFSVSDLNMSQFEAISSCSVAFILGRRDPTPDWLQPSFQGVVESGKISPEPPVVWAEHFPWLLLFRPFPSPSLETLQHLNIFFVVRGPKPDKEFEVQPYQCQ